MKGGSTMILLANRTNFDQDWAQEAVSQMLGPAVNVALMPLSQDEGWASDARLFRERFASGSEYRDDLLRPFRAYGIPPSQVHWLDYHDVTRAGMEAVLARCDVLCLVGDDPEACMHRIEDLDLKETLSSWTKNLIGISAGAEILMPSFFPLLTDSCLPQEGLGLVAGLDLDTHYEENAAHLKAVIRRLEDNVRPQIILPEKGAVLLDGSRMDLLGEAFAAGPQDLDEIYNLYEALREREDWS